MALITNKMKIRTLALFLLICIGTKAQEYKLFVASTDKSIQLKWLSEGQENNASYTIFRKEDSGIWQKINEQPISASPVIKESELKSKKNLFPKDSAYAFYVTYKNKKETEANKQAYSDYLVTIGGIYNNKLAKHLGIFYEDITVTKGKKYQGRNQSTNRVPRVMTARAASCSWHTTRASRNSSKLFSDGCREETAPGFPAGLMTPSLDCRSLASGA